ncbi:hypothetical protein M9H77_31311 [Catharanthus roseus]|uniref:Uncharacterized protein n=1 Tax=Catharanthus roseus TaxID=4058 RepID=A0ACC0A0J1_CATRO|nr:hypothetical protein M9H77_31311 [Catharanthus roseus]
MEFEGEEGFLRGSRDRIDRAPQAKPEGCYTNRPAGGRRRGPDSLYNGSQTTVFPSDKTYHRLSSAFSMKKKSNPDLRKPFPFPAASPSLHRAFPLMVRESIPLSELGGHPFQP